MAGSQNVAWRVRNNGSNTNGGGYDCSVLSAATGTHGSWATSGGVTTFTDATAAAFTSAMVGAGIYIVGLGHVTVLSYVDASHITITTPFVTTLQNSGAGCSYSWTIGGGTDYSQQDAPQATWAAGTNGLTCTGSASTTLTDGDARGLFTAAMVGNAIKLAGGTGFDVTTSSGVFFVTQFTDANNVVLDRSPASATGAASGATGKLGGAHADFWSLYSVRITANCVIGPGQAIYVMGYQTTVNPASYVYDYSGLPFDTIQITPGSGYNNPNLMSGDLAGPGVPVIKLAGTNGVAQFGNSSFFKYQYLWMVNQGAPFSSWGTFLSCADNVFEGIIWDQNGYDIPFCQDTDTTYINCEFFSSRACIAANGAIIVNLPGGGSSYMTGCNIHDVCTHGIAVGAYCTLTNTIISNVPNGQGVTIIGFSSKGAVVQNCTIDACHVGLWMNLNQTFHDSIVINNIISNCSQYGLFVDAAPNDIGRTIIDYNVFYNNATHRQNIGAGVHDTVLSTNPYIGNSTDQNYTLA